MDEKNIVRLHELMTESFALCHSLTVRSYDRRRNLVYRHRCERLKKVARARFDRRSAVWDSLVASFPS